MHPELDKLIEMALADGQVTDKEREIILRKAEKLGLDMDEVEMYLEGRNTTKKYSISNQLILEKTELSESKTLISDAPYQTKFNHKKVISIAPALLNKDAELKLKILEINKLNTEFITEFENLNNELNELENELNEHKKYLDHEIHDLLKEKKIKSYFINDYINEIEKLMIEKFQINSLKFNNPEKLLEIGNKSDVIDREGVWDLSKTKKKSKYKVNLNFFILAIGYLVIVEILMYYITGFKNSTNLITTIFIVVFGIGVLRAGATVQLAKINNSKNFSPIDLQDVISIVDLKFTNEFHHFNQLNNSIINLIQKENKIQSIDFTNKLSYVNKLKANQIGKIINSLKNK
jgi:hypothetical protein